MAVKTTSTTTQYIKNNWISILLVLIFLWVMFAPYNCGNRFAKDAPGKNDTVSVESKTVQVPQPPVYIPMYIPQQSGSTTYPVVIPQDRQASADLLTLTKQYNELVKDFLATRTYKDSIPLKDSAGNRVGVVNLIDQVSENKLKPRDVNYQLSFPHTTTTITIREPYKAKRQLYAGVNLAGTPAQIVNGADLGAIYKDKKDNMWQLKAGARSYGSQLQPNIEIGRYWKISLGKK